MIYRGAGGSSEETKHELETLRQEIEDMRKQDSELSSYISSMDVVLKEMTADRSRTGSAFVTHDDIRGLPCFRQNTVMAIKAPAGTTLEVPDPDEGMTNGNRRFQIFLKSETGPIEVFLVSQVAYERAAENGAPLQTPTDGSERHAIGSQAHLEQEAELGLDRPDLQYLALDNTDDVPSEAMLRSGPPATTNASSNSGTMPLSAATQAPSMRHHSHGLRRSRVDSMDLHPMIPLIPEVSLEDELPAHSVELPPDVGITDMFDAVAPAAAIASPSKTPLALVKPEPQ